MAYDIAPSFVRFEYTSSAGIHTMFIPTRAWEPGTGAGTFLNWTNTQTDAQTMISNMANALKALMHGTSTITRATIFTKAVGQPPEPRASVTLNAAGTETSTSWRLAVQATMTIRDESFKLFKIVLLDIPAGDNFNKATTFVGLPAWESVFNEVTDANMAWSSRFGARPATLVSITKTLNEKLRRAYRLA